MSVVSIAIDEEIALEGLDGITLDSLWFRLSERLKIPLPFYESFKNKLWKVILKRNHFEFFKLAQPRKTVGTTDRTSLIAGDEEALQQVQESYYIYSWSPVDDLEVQGSCSEFKTREPISRSMLENQTIAEITEIYGQKLVIVASQKLRSSVLIPSNIGRNIDINNHTYCLLERIGRSRYFGETTSGKFSINDFVKDSKLIHYFRLNLMKNELVVRQQFAQKVSAKKTAITQIFHLPKFFVPVQSTQKRHLEVLLTYLKTKEGNYATLDEVRNVLQLASKTTIASIKARRDIFLYQQFPYSEVFPNASKAESTFKKGKERKVMAVKLIDPNYDICDLFKNDQNGLEPVEEDEEGFLDCSRQQIKRPLMHQIVEKIEESKHEGLSQTDIGTYFGLTKLNARGVTRKAVRDYEMTSYLKDEGRQRVSKFISKKYLPEKNKEIVDQVAQILKKAEEPRLAENPISFAPFEDFQIIASEQSPTNVSIPLSAIKQEISQNDSVIKITQQTSSQVFDGEFLRPQSVSMSGETVVILPDNECSFVDNVENVKVTLKFLNNIPGMQKNVIGLQQAIAANKVSQKVLTRMNLILDIMKTKTVIDTMNLLQMLRQKETNFTEVCCRKSMLTLCARLACDNLIKVIQMELISATNVVKLIYFGEPNVTFDMRCWHSIIEEQKIQHFITMPKPLIRKEDDFTKVFSNVSVISIMSKSCGEFDAQSTRHENFPKFMKYRLFHEFLFYLIYNYPKEIEKIPVKRAIETWQRENQRLTDYEEIAERISICYSTEISWKMFIPPLNQQLEYQNGWGFLRDIIHRIPLILFVKFVRLTNTKTTSELNEYINHPIKSNYLLHFLPQKLRTQLFGGRKFIFAVTELCKRLCWLGLLQFGPSRTKELDQVYIYLNRRAMLLDTRSSEPGYLEVSEKEYPKLSFFFDSFDTITKYWTTMYDICINTDINKKSTAIGKTIVIEPLYTKSELAGSLKVQTPTSAPLNDNGEIPGDRKGAGGLDKSFMSHLKQSWSRTIDKKKRPISALSIERKMKKVCSEINSESKKKKKLKASAASVSKAKAILSSRNVGSKSKIIRKVKPKKMSIKEMRKRGELYDQVDKDALKLMKTLRVTWSEIEDKTLLLLKVAMKFAFPIEAQRSHYINCTVLRDVLHWRTSRSHNKTSKACQRRLAYLMKSNKQFKEQTYLYLEELRTNRYFVSKYSNFAERLKKIYNQEQIYVVVKIHLVEMVYRMHQVFFKQFLDRSMEPIEPKEMLSLPSNYAELTNEFHIVNPNKLVNECMYFEPKNVTEIEISTLTSLIHGAVCSTNDKVSHLYYLHEAYKKFSDENLGAAVSQLRHLAVISLNKSQRTKDKVVMPYSISPFHLSSRYATQLMGVHISIETYDEYFESIKLLSTCDDGRYQLNTVNCGWLFLLCEMDLSGKISMTCGKSIIADSTVRKKTNFEKISDDYMLMKRNNEQQKDNQKSERIFRLPVDNNSDEKFIFIDDPLEIFFKLDTQYLHIFCILQSIEHKQRNELVKWSIPEDSQECSLKHCIIRAGASFPIEIQKIACHCYDIIKNILNDNEPGPSKFDELSITKYNLVNVFDKFIEKQCEERQEAMKKDVGKSNASEFHRKISTKLLLQAIQRLSSEEVEDGAWLSDYKRISHKNDDEIFDDDDDIDITAKSLNSSRDANVSMKASDTFSVNLSTISVELNYNVSNDKCAIDGEIFDKEFVPFGEQEKVKMLEKIKGKYIWMPQDLVKQSFEKDVENILVSKNDLTLMENIYNFIKSKGQEGATVSDMQNQFGEEKKKASDILCKFIDHKIILRAGVNEARYVHKEFAAFWLIDTFYLSKEDEDANAPPEKRHKGDEEARVSTNLEEIPMEIETFDNPEIGENKEQSSEERKNRTRYSYFLHPFPWTRVGMLTRTLNRRCVDKWLGSILNHVSLYPAITIKDLCARFNILTPVQVLDLCETLAIIGCVRIMSYNSLEIDIFSNYDESTEEIGPFSHLDSFENSFIEVEATAFQRLAFFIGKKKYKIPFV